MHATTYPYKHFQALCAAVNAVHLSTHRKVHQWRSAAYELTYEAKPREWTATRAGDSAPFFRMDCWEQPHVLTYLLGPDRAAFDAAGIALTDSTPSAAVWESTDHDDIHPVCGSCGCGPCQCPDQPDDSTPSEPACEPEPERSDPAPKPKRTRRNGPPKVSGGSGEHSTPTAPGCVTVDAKALRAALSTVKPSVATKTALPILTAVHLSTPSDGVFRIAATNLETATTTEIPCAGSLAAPLCLEHSALTDAVPKTGTVGIGPVADQWRATLTADGMTATVDGFDPDDFPILPTVDGPTVRLSTPRYLASLAFAAAACLKEDDSRPVLTSVNHRTDRDRLRLTGCDGFRLHDVSTPDEPGCKLSFLLPWRASKALTAAFGKDSEPVALTIGPSAVAYRSARTVVISRTIEGTYPDVAQLIPREFAARFTIDRAAWLKAAEACAKIAKDNGDLTRHSIDPERTHLESTAKASQRGDVSVLTPVDDVRGQVPTIVLNGQYLVSTLKAMPGKTVLYQNNASGQAVLLTGDDEHRAVVMPIVIGAA